MANQKELKELLDIKAEWKDEKRRFLKWKEEEEVRHRKMIEKFEEKEAEMKEIIGQMKKIIDQQVRKDEERNIEYKRGEEEKRTEHGAENIIETIGNYNKLVSEENETLRQYKEEKRRCSIAIKGLNIVNRGNAMKEIEHWIKMKLGVKCTIILCNFSKGVWVICLNAEEKREIMKNKYKLSGEDIYIWKMIGRGTRGEKEKK